MNPTLLFPSHPWPFALTFSAFMLLGVIRAGGAPAESKPLPGVDQLPTIKELPNPFVFSDGSPVKTPADWRRRREELKTLFLYYEYGRPAPDPGNVKGQEQAAGKDGATGAETRQILLTMGPSEKISTTLFITIPPGKGPFPTIVKGDLCWGRVAPEIVGQIIGRGYALVEFDRTNIAPDDKTRDKGVLAAFPDADQGDLAAWAWGYARVNDYLLTQHFVDKGKLIATGHSRGGKAALLAGALDERIALTVPNGSGAGGAGCYRVQPPKTEDLKAIVTHFPNWFGPRFAGFIGHVDQLPFDQHEVRALVAPRALLDTEGEGDIWANAHGTQQSYLAAKEVYKFLGAPDKTGIHFRPGKHEQNEQDFAALLDFADHVLLGKPAKQDFNKVPFPEDPKAFEWTAP
ncbi:MAG TPA: hypothetical protein VFC78_05385 [Tepidisphaeraceae bacterium]|nr:hypothetical protein [Tepidisphaeraceae bacterium]